VLSEYTIEWEKDFEESREARITEKAAGSRISTNILCSMTLLLEREKKKGLETYIY
jgi:hypothetical protein